MKVAKLTIIAAGVCGAADTVAGTEASRVATQKVVDQLRALVRAWRVRDGLIIFTFITVFLEFVFQCQLTERAAGGDVCARIWGLGQRSGDGFDRRRLAMRRYHLG